MGGNFVAQEKKSCKAHNIERNYTKRHKLLLRQRFLKAGWRNDAIYRV